MMKTDNDSKITSPLVQPRGWELIVPLVERRIRSPYSAAQVAAAMGAGESSVSKAERGLATITESFARRYEEALDRLDEAYRERSVQQSENALEHV